MATIRDLIDRLEDLAEELADSTGDQTEVLAVYQPTYPLVGAIDGLCSSEDMDEGWDPDDPEKPDPVVWLAVGYAPDNRNPYGPSDAIASARF